MEQREEYKGFWFSVNTPLQVRNAIVHAHSNLLRVRIHLGNKETGKLWLEEHDIIGRIGRSTGSQEIPLLIPRANSHGGGALLDHCILGIQCVEGRAWLYKAPNMVLPELYIIKATANAEGLPFAVYREKEVQARFKTEQKAKNYIAFMRGERMKVA